MPSDRRGLEIYGSTRVTPRTIKVARHNGYLDINRTSAVYGAWFAITNEAADNAAQVLLDAAYRTFEQDGAIGGFPAWPSNADSTEEWKGHEKVMLGKPGHDNHVVQNIEVRKSIPGNAPVRVRDGSQSRVIGVFNQAPHPTGNGKLTIAEVALLHEFGDGHSPPRPWLSRVGDAVGPEATGIAALTISARLQQIMTVYPPVLFPLGRGPAGKLSEGDD